MKKINKPQFKMTLYTINVFLLVCSKPLVFIVLLLWFRLNSVHSIALYNSYQNNLNANRNGFEYFKHRFIYRLLIEILNKL